MNSQPDCSQTKRMSEGSDSRDWAFLFLRWTRGPKCSGAVDRDEFLHTGSLSLACWVPNLGNNARGGEQYHVRLNWDSGIRNKLRDFKGYRDKG